MSHLAQIGGLTDRRLVSRVLHCVTGGAAASHLPRLQDVDPWFIGDDWVNCALVRVRHPYRQSEFIMVGDNLAPSETLDREQIWKCPATTLLGLTLSYIEQAVEERSFLVIEGTANHLERPILYRALLLPLSEDDKAIEAVLIAANSRLARSNETISTTSRLAWVHRCGSLGRSKE